MTLKENVSLKGYSTMRLGGTARYLVTVTNRREVAEAASWAEKHGVPVLMVGGGSNIVWRDEGFDGLIVINAIKGYEDVAEGDEHYLTIGAGENWDETVAKAVAAGLTGIECLSLVPGNAGGTPVQNVGAYGQEIAETLVQVEVYDTVTKTFCAIAAKDCDFSYRSSRFKSADHGRFFILNLTLKLHIGNPKPPFYAGLQRYLDEHTITNFTPAVIRDAVVAIRTAKLPDPAKVANTGSFFGNPIVPDSEYARLAAEFGDSIPHWSAGEGKTKLAAAWLIEQAGFKDFHDKATGMATWPAQSLVLINEKAGSTADLLKFKQQIVDTVAEKFGVTLQQEPELLP
jgi:UDP-N-acetylmuramate dehydrogenase